MKPSDALATHRAALRGVILSHGLRHPRVFGSALHGTDVEGSDLDLLVNPSDSTTLLNLAGVKVDAEDLLGVKVDVLTPNALPSKFRDKVLREAQPL